MHLPRKILSFEKVAFRFFANIIVNYIKKNSKIIDAFLKRPRFSLHSNLAENIKSE